MTTRTMVKLDEGFYSDEELPQVDDVSPRDIRIGDYFLPEYFGRMEKEEAAARLIYLLQQHGSWAGVTWRHVLDQMEKEFESEKAWRNAQESYRTACLEYEVAHPWWVLYNFFTLGLYGRWNPEPKEPKKPEILVKPKSPQRSVCFMRGPDAVVEGFIGLKQEGYVRIADVEPSGEDGEKFSVIFPTQQLIDYMAARQGLRTEA